MRSVALRRFLQKKSGNLGAPCSVSEAHRRLLRNRGAWGEQRVSWVAGVEVISKAVASPQWLARITGMRRHFEEGDRRMGVAVGL